MLTVRKLGFYAFIVAMALCVLWHLIDTTDYPDKIAYLVNMQMAFMVLCVLAVMIQLKQIENKIDAHLDGQHENSMED